MVSRNKSDFLSNLPNCLLISIISLLPFKECVRTSVLSERWRYLCLETTNLVFKESDFVNLSALDKKTKMVERKFFVDIMSRWISVFTGEFIESFELHLSNLEGFEKDIISLIEFATSKRVKNLVLDFSDTISKKDSAIDHLLKLIYYQTHEIDISRLVFNLLYVESLTICSFLIQVNSSSLFQLFKIHNIFITFLHLMKSISLDHFIISSNKLGLEN